MLESFSPLLVGVLSETRIDFRHKDKQELLSVPYWSGCSVKHFGEVLVCFLVNLSVPYWSGCSVKRPDTTDNDGDLNSLSVPYWSGCSVKRFDRDFFEEDD